MIVSWVGDITEIVAWLDRYNRVRRHSHCALRAPMTYEKLNTPAALAA